MAPAPNRGQIDSRFMLRPAIDREMPVDPDADAFGRNRPQHVPAGRQRHVAIGGDGDVLGRHAWRNRSRRDVVEAVGPFGAAGGPARIFANAAASAGASGIVAKPKNRTVQSIGAKNRE